MFYSLYTCHIHNKNKRTVVCLSLIYVLLCLASSEYMQLAELYVPTDTGTNTTTTILQTVMKKKIFLSMVELAASGFGTRIYILSVHERGTQP